MTVHADQLALPIHSPISAAPDRVRPVSHAVRQQMLTWGATEVFDLYWQFAAMRQDVLMRRLGGESPPWTADPILLRHRFTNPYRFSDRVSQHLLRHVQYDQERPALSTILRTLLFKIFNRIDTWESIVAEFGEPTVDTFDPAAYAALLSELRSQGRRIYSPAYIIPNPALGSAAKHENHLRLLGRILHNGTIERLADARDLEELFGVLLRIPSLGPFLAFQYAVDLNYSDVTDADENGFVVAGPGARDGLLKCFASLPRGSEADAILWVAETQDDHFERLGVRFQTIGGRPLKPIDCQNLFCEVDKYARVTHPHIAGYSGRSRIKQLFAPEARDPLPPLFMPPKWTAHTIS